jgi:hypothetical protein
MTAKNFSIFVASSPDVELGFYSRSEHVALGSHQRAASFVPLHPATAKHSTLRMVAATLIGG